MTVETVKSFFSEPCVNSMEDRRREKPVYSTSQSDRYTCMHVIAMQRKISFGEKTFTDACFYKSIVRVHAGNTTHTADIHRTAHYQVIAINNVELKT